MRSPEVVEGDCLIDLRGLDRRCPVLGSKVVARQRCASGGGEQKVVVAYVVREHVLAQQRDRGVVDADSTLLVVLRVVLDEAALPGGEVFLATSTMTRRTVMILVVKSMSHGRSAMSSPQRSPVSMASSTIVR